MQILGLNVFGCMNGENLGQFGRGFMVLMNR